VHLVGFTIEIVCTELQ